jgi:pilus assembly protein FimV
VLQSHPFRRVAAMDPFLLTHSHARMLQIVRNDMRLKALTLGILLASTALGSAALTLGRARGAAWIGQSLDLVVPVQLDAGQTADALCAEADVFHADSRVDGSRVHVLVEPTAQPDTINLRVQSSSLIDEPVVTIYLRAGCNQKSTRRYVLLADFPSETSAPAPRAAAEPTPRPLPAVPQELTSSAATSTSPTTQPPAKPVQSAPTVRKPPTPRPASQPAAAERPAVANTAPATAPKAATPGRARLKLDPLESLAERIKTLESTTTTAVPLEEMVKDSQRIQQLQNDVKALLDQAAKNEASLLAMRMRMEKAESERVPVALVYGLGALVVLCLAAIAVLWNRRTDQSNWRNSLTHTAVPETIQEPITSTLLKDMEPDPPPPPKRQPPAPNVSAFQAREPNPAMDVDVNLMDMDEEAFGKLLKPQPTQPAPLAVAEPAPPALAEVSSPHPDFNSESMFDLRQQADFFVKLGKTDEAIEALEQRIRQNSKDCPLVFLELLHIANAHSLKTDFRQFRDECQQVFNIAIPEFALFRNEGRGLEGYPSLLNHITALWPSPRVLDVIESCVLRDPFEKNAEPFDLAAFRELITLHGVARTQIHSQESEPPPSAEDSQHVDLDIF